MSAEQGPVLGCSHTRVQTAFGSSAASMQRGKVSHVAQSLERSHEKALDGHQSTDTKDTQDTTKSPQHTQQAHEFAPGTLADCMLASSCSPGRLCPLCLCVSLTM